MAELVIAAAGAAIGSSAGWGIAALGLSGGSVGWIAGSMLANAFSPAQKSYGPRLEDTSVYSSSYGVAIPFAVGNSRLAGNIIWASNKREIATTTRQGKGGGKSKHTTYTYEVDLLILLTDNEIEGVSRVWSNGKLIWTKDQNATVKERLASDNIIDWRRITVYTGEASQLPDPTYETAVGIGSAPAYRGRGSVFIEGLQLGSSGQIPNLSFEIGLPWQTDGLTMFQTTFANGSSMDISPYSAINGAGTQTDGTIYNGYYEVTINSNKVVGILWQSEHLRKVYNKPYTFEAFFSIHRVDGTIPTLQSFLSLTMFAYYWGLQLKIENSFYPPPHGPEHLIYYDNVDSTHTYRGTGSFINALPEIHHFALSCDSVGVYNVYIDGVRMLGPLSGTNAVYPTGGIYLGGSSPGNAGAIRYRYYGARVRHEEVYTGASFIPPNGPADWGPP